MFSANTGLRAILRGLPPTFGKQTAPVGSKPIVANTIRPHAKEIPTHQCLYSHFCETINLEQSCLLVDPMQ